MERPLHVGRGQARNPISGGGELTDVEDGATYVITIGHSTDAAFAQADPPEFGDWAGVAFKLRLDGTNGSQFRVEIEVAEGYGAAYGYDYGYGGAGPDVLYTWTRDGELNGPA